MAAARKPAPRRAAKGSAKSPAPSRLAQRTPLAEWIAAGLGLVLTLAVLVTSVWEALTQAPGAPALTLEAEATAREAGGFVTPITLRNASSATAASIWVRGTLERGGRAIETRRALFDYAPGKGAVRGGLVFQRDPADYRLRLDIEGYQEP